ncbi:MAG TPA: molybdate ABC transporter substrate-binding protein [Candidatus Polarisedimenticolia bacterium]|nr:molybdate ABC transporter substrate-binding protein [Candidatus Polarisedimenticolia bacterium]
MAIAVLIAVQSVLATAPAAGPASPEINFYAAASLRDVLQRLAPACEEALDAHLVFNFGASNDLARQIEAGNKADLFFSADEAWMDHVAQAGLVDPDSRHSLLSNRLVVVGPRDTPLNIQSARDLVGPGVRWISLANPEAVPAGKYARAWLEKAGLWDGVRDRVLPGLDVRAALAAVESGGAEVGVVYRTDAAMSKKVRVLYEVPESEGPRISYPVAALRDRPRLDVARRVVAWLSEPTAAATFEQYGFIVQGPPH